MRVAVIDGQGGGMGKQIIERLKSALGEEAWVIALGTNAMATALMLRSGADEGASGENAIVVNAPRVDVILGTVGIISANSMLGELTPSMARAIAESPAQKVLIPFNRCGIQIAGLGNEPLPYYITAAIDIVKQLATCK